MSSIKHCFLGLLGDFDLEYFIETPFPFMTIVLLIFYVVLITILLLNLLIAMMGDTFADVKKSAKKLWFVDRCHRRISKYFLLIFRHLERTRIALDIEQNMSKSERKLKRNKYWVDVRGERFLQVEQIDNELFKQKDLESED